MVKFIFAITLLSIALIAIFNESPECVWKETGFKTETYFCNGEAKGIKLL